MKSNCIRIIWFAFLLNVVSNQSFSQCCSAGGGCPIAGGASQGVLNQNMIELNANYQYVSTTKFMNGDVVDTNFLDRYSSKYGYFRLGYGLNSHFTFSVEAGYYFDKTQIGLNKRDTISTKGWGDLILFPRYNVLNKTKGNAHYEITTGLGIKIPLGNPKDTLKQIEKFSGTEYYILKPVAIRTTTGGQDVVFYLSLLRGFPKQNFRIFTNILYLKKGWNELGEKSGNYKSIGLYASKTIKKNLGVTLQLKYEVIDQMKVNSDLYNMGFYNYDPEATGSKKVLLVPQLSYNIKTVTAYVSSEFALYQYVNKQQIASQYFITTGITYSFHGPQKKVMAGLYFCPMHPNITSPTPGKCPDCGMDLELKK